MTLRRALAALALCLMASSATARGLVIVDQDATSGLASWTDSDIRRQEHRMVNATLDVMNRWGIDYKVMTKPAVTTEMARTGLVYYNRLRATSAWAYDASGPSEQFDWVIIMNSGYSRTGYTPGNDRLSPPWPRTFNGCYPCSMSVGGVARAPLVPQLLLTGGARADPPQAGALPMSNVSLSVEPCSTGVASFSSPVALPSVLDVPGQPGSFLSNANICEGYVVAPSVTGGVRALVRRHYPYFFAIQKYNGNINTNAPDSILTGAGADTVTVWERPFTGLYAGANNTQPIKPIVFADIMGVSPCGDSTGNIIPCEFDSNVLLIALARLDSLTSGGVFTKKRTAAIVVSGGFERTLRRLPGGANNDDSTVVKASIDSLASIGAPITLTVNVDSVASYPNEVAWWTGRGLRVRFAPVATYGVSDTSALAASANWSNARVVDVFGRYRNRAFYGDSSTFHTYASGGADSSIYQGLLYLKNKARTLGLTPLSGTLIAPLDDWSPKNMLSKSNALDSLVRVFRLAGYSTALVDVQRPEADINRIRTGGKDRVRGWYGKQFNYYNRLSAETFKFIGHTGYGINGGARQLMVTGDSTSVPLVVSFGGAGPPWTPTYYAAIGRFWHGWTHDAFTDFDWFQSDGQSANGGYGDIAYPLVDGFEGFRKSSVLKMHVSDLGGQPNGPPARPGWWAIKSIVRQFNAINAIAGRNVVSLGYPEDIEP